MTNKKYAELLVNYCLNIQEGDKLLIQSTTLAEDLVREVYKVALKSGAFPEVELRFRGQNRIFFEEASDSQLNYISPINKLYIDSFDAYLSIRAPFNLKEEANVDPQKRIRRAGATKKLSETFARRTGNGALKRSLCQYPTDACAQEAGMSLDEYREFVFKACYLNLDNPNDRWLEIRKEQQKIVDFLNDRSSLRYVNERSDITFSVEGRTWINSDGRVNMPSGEVFTGPVEDSLNGRVFFDYPSIYMGKEVSGVSFEVKDGRIERWSADKGEEVLDEIMKIDGARYFGEAAIGTNYNIDKPTKNILFDEKIGGTIHMAVGQSYLNTGGKNESTIHWDLIADMTKGGQIYADDSLVYENGQFLI